jgi:hypothetical protein
MKTEKELEENDRRGAETVGKTLREVKAIAGKKVRWRCFVEALCSGVE